MRTRSFAAAAGLAFVFGCGPRWTVIHQATPDPFLHHPDFTVEPMHFEHTTVGEKTEAAYRADKDADQQASWQADKDAMSSTFGAALATSGQALSVGPPRANAALVRPIVNFIEPGFYAAIASHATQVKMTVMFLDSQGAVLDEIAIESSIAAGMTNAASGTRLREAAEDLGRVTAKYLHTRVAPD